MNREKKQLVVVGVLAFLVLSVGAFQFTRKDPPPPAASTTEKPKPIDGKDKVVVPTRNYPELLDLSPKDPFEIAEFVSGTKPVVTPTVTTPSANPGTIGGTVISKNGKENLKRLPFGGPDMPMPFPDGKTLVPLAPPEPVFEYSLVGIVEGAHPMAVFEDGKGNQRLLEAGQSVGSSATIIQISRGKVRVKFNEKTLTLNVGGNPNAK